MREDWIYNTWGCAIAGLIIERLTGEPLYETIKDDLLAPLAMNSTSFRPDIDLIDQVLAEPYAALSDGSHHRLERMEFQGSVFEAGGMFSTVDDLLKWAKKWVGIFSLGDVDPELLTGRIAIGPSSLRERSYATGGWIRTQLPNTLGLMGDNAHILPIADLPEIGKVNLFERLMNGTYQTPLEMIHYHQSQTAGYCSNIVLVPGSGSAIVVLTNSLALGDVADWLAQATLQALLGQGKLVDYDMWSKKCAAKCLQKHNRMRAKLEAQRRPNTMPRPIKDYTGHYYTDNYLHLITITSKSDNGDDLLRLAFRGIANKTSQPYDLRHLHDDTFEFSMERDDAAKRGRFHEFSPEAFKIKFGTDEDGVLWEFYWADDPGFCSKGRKFAKRY